jgi:predicted DNA-binding transcriptional regulator AlpA
MKHTPDIFAHSGYLRLPAIIGNRKKGIAGLVPVGSTTWWNGVKAGRFPAPVKLGPRITAWRARDIAALIEELGR